MRILVTGAKGFFGRNLVEAMKNIRDGKDMRYKLQISEIYEYDIQNTLEDLKNFCADCDFVFNLAGVNRPENESEFMEGNYSFGEQLLTILKEYENKCPIVLSSSIQASLLGRYNGSAYGKSKLESEKLFFHYAMETGVKVFIYRFPNLFGKWCKPNYNSVVATFCHNIANDLPIKVHDRNTQIELAYIDDLIDEMLCALQGIPHCCDYDGLNPVLNPEGKYCYVPITYKVTLDKIIDLLMTFHDQPQTLCVPEIPNGSFEKKLYSTFVSYLPKEKILIPLKMNIDQRGSFTELLKTEKCGQFSVNISKPGVVKGQHWHNTKWEFFIVVSGHGLIQERRIGTDEVFEFEVSGEKIEAVHMLPGFTHNIINLSETEDLITVMWANEQFDPSRPDTFKEEI